MVNLKVEIKEEKETGDLSVIVYPHKINPTDNEIMQSVMLKSLIERSIEFSNISIREEFEDFILNRIRNDDMKQLLNELVDETIKSLKASEE